LDSDLVVEFSTCVIHKRLHKEALPSAHGLSGSLLRCFLSSDNAHEIHVLNTTGRKTCGMTATITVRLSEKQRKELARYGRISDVVRDALRLYLQEKNSGRIIGRLAELQRSKVRGTIAEDLRFIRADRDR